MPPNKLNNLDPKSWLKFQKSWFVHNPPPRKKGVLVHPAKFPETMAQEFIEFFTRQGETVLDPMAGTGSTLVAALDRLDAEGFALPVADKMAPRAGAMSRRNVAIAAILVLVLGSAGAWWLSTRAQPAQPAAQREPISSWSRQRSTRSSAGTLEVNPTPSPHWRRSVASPASP